MDIIDFKKSEKKIYMPSTKPTIIEIPKMNYIMIHGSGNPNIEGGEYQNSIPILYGIHYAIKMSKKGTRDIKGYYDYVVPPLEGLWWMNGLHGIDYVHKENFHFCSMMRLPEYVDQEIFDWACAQLQKKHPKYDLSIVSFESFEEGICAQMMHKGPYDDEPATLKQLLSYIDEQGYVTDYDSISSDGQLRKHHEIYLSDPRKCKAETMKTVIRLPIRRM